MKIAILSDLHANFDALSALPNDYDELWVLGDLVNYGPQPAEVVDTIAQRASLIVQGNHDRSIGFGEDPRCTPRYRAMAEETRKFTDSVLGPKQKDFLRNLPVGTTAERNATQFCLVHAIPSNPLYGYCPEESDKWVAELGSVKVDILLVGHTHTPFIRRIGKQTVCNPGSLGQPKTGNPKACYALWQDGKLDLKSFSYPVEKTVERIKKMPLSSEIQEDLIRVLQTGSI